MVFSRIKDIVRPEFRDAAGSLEGMASERAPLESEEQEKPERKGCFWCRMMSGTVMVGSAAYLAKVSYEEYLEDLKPKKKDDPVVLVARKTKLLRPKASLMSAYLMAAVFGTLGCCILVDIKVPFLNDN